MQTFAIDGNKYLTYRENVWDSKVFDKKVYEILGIKTDEENEGSILTDFLSEISTDQTAKLVTIRVENQNLRLLKILQEKDFRIVEMSYTLLLRNLQRIDTDKHKDKITLTRMDEEHLEDVQDIASEAFHHSRYHLDPYLKLEHIKQRNRNWVRDMHVREIPARVLCEHGKVVSFVFFEFDGEDSATLLLGGSREGKGFLTPFVWSKLLAELKESGIKKVKTIIQTNNIGSLKLHLQFGFEVEKAFYGLNKHTKG